LSLGFQEVQLLEGAIEGSPEVALVTGKHGEALTVIRQPLKDPGYAVLGGHLGELVIHVFGAAFEFVGEQTGFDSPYATQAPACDGHCIYQIHFNGIGRLELLDVVVEE